MFLMPNKPDAVNPAMALWLTIEDQWRRVTDLERSAQFDTFMTMLPEAQEFVARWRRILIPWRAHTDAEAVRDMERSCIGVIGGMALVIGCATTLPSSWKIGVAAFAFIIAAIAFWLSLRLRAVAGCSIRLARSHFLI